MHKSRWMTPKNVERARLTRLDRVPLALLAGSESITGPLPAKAGGRPLDGNEPTYCQALFTTSDRSSIASTPQSSHKISLRDLQGAQANIPGLIAAVKKNQRGLQQPSFFKR
jgi:hypothetical protein